MTIGAKTDGNDIADALAAVIAVAAAPSATDITAAANYGNDLTFIVRWSRAGSLVVHRAFPGTGSTPDTRLDVVTSAM
jgi:hypothetical protein